MDIISIKNLERKCPHRSERTIYEGSRDDLLSYLKGEALSHKSLYHYTQWDSFVKMMTPVAVGDSGDHRVMLLSRADKMNDKTEKGWGKQVFFTCFSYSKYEDVAMWMNYGKRSPNAVRVRFDGMAVREWLGEHQEAKDCVYAADDQKCGGFKFERIPPEDIECIEYADVAYVIHDKLMNRKHCGNVEYGRDFFIVRGERGDFEWSNDVYDGTPRKTEPALPAFFKKRGWGYERETRLVITLKSGVKSPKRIAIVFDDVFRRFDVLSKDGLSQMRRVECTDCDDCGEESMRNVLMQGPWYDEKYSSDEVIGSCGIGFADVKSRSDYGKEIEIVSNIHKTPMQQYVEAQSYANSLKDRDVHQITEDDKSFLRPLSVDLIYAAKRINTHRERHKDKTGKCVGADYKPNKYKLQRLEVLDINRLAALARYRHEAHELFERFHDIASSSESKPKWSGKIGWVCRYH